MGSGTGLCGTPFGVDTCRVRRSADRSHYACVRCYYKRAKVIGASGELHSVQMDEGPQGARRIPEEMKVPTKALSPRALPPLLATGCAANRIGEGVRYLPLSRPSDQRCRGRSVTVIQARTSSGARATRRLECDALLDGIWRLRIFTSEVHPSFHAAAYWKGFGFALFQCRPCAVVGSTIQEVCVG